MNGEFSGERSYMGGYEDDVMMAGGRFVEGWCIEL
ncbi:methionine gamma-lyase family protein [Staphylococcus hominis]|nr:methionine gamma-lyase family protein [Staphylococcus hominis]